MLLPGSAGCGRRGPAILAGTSVPIPVYDPSEPIAGEGPEWVGGRRTWRIRTPDPYDRVVAFYRAALPGATVIHSSEDDDVLVMGPNTEFIKRVSVAGKGELLLAVKVFEVQNSGKTLVVIQER